MFSQSKCFYIVMLLLFSTTIFAQKTTSEAIIKKTTVKKHLTYLADDALKGRDTGSPGADSAAWYIARQFETYGLQLVDGAEEWFQPITFAQVTPQQSGVFQLANQRYAVGDDVLLMQGKAMQGSFEVVFVEHGWVDGANSYNDYEGKDVKGKIVLTLPGSPVSDHPFAAFDAAKNKKKWAMERGAVGMIELFRLNFPWDYFKSYFNNPSLKVAQEFESEKDFLYGWLKEKDIKETGLLLKKQPLVAQLSTDGATIKYLEDQNVIGMLPGTDPELSDEYVLISAHYDHVGVDPNAKRGQDSIYNGARDNAIGVTAMLAAAQALGNEPPTRPTVFLAVTAEEKGLLGSEYYVNNPLIPLDKTIYNINNDGGGYNSTEHVAIIGYGRTGTNAQLDASVEPFGLKVAANPMPEENLFDRSDNVNFAKVGIPAIDYAPGGLSFDQELMKYYHQVADESESIDFDYVHRFSQSFARFCRLVADMEEKPFWVKGDKYEAAGKRLYMEDR